MMVVKPKIREFFCTTAHPAGIFANVKRMVEFVKFKKKELKKENTLIIGCSTGYGLSCRIVSAFLKKSPTIGVMFEKPPKLNRTATAGWYNTAAFEKFAQEENLYNKTINGDAFSEEIIEQTINIIKKDLKKIDLIIYSLAAPRRKMPNGTIVSSVLKPVGKPYINKTLNLETNEVFNVKIEPATEEEIENTVKVMGGENLENWVNKLKDADVLEKGCKIISFSYEGPTITHKIYKDGTIGYAKKHILETTKKINEKFKDVNAFVSYNKALVTQSSAAIPVVPLYLTILYKVMKEENLHEGCIEQMFRLFTEKLEENKNIEKNNIIRLDNYEMLPKIQEKVKYAWEKINSSNLKEFADLNGYYEDFLNMFGFAIKSINYEEETETLVNINNLIN